MEILNQDIQYLKGVGPNRKVLLNKLGIFTIQDMLTYFPRDYEDRTKFSNISELQDGDNVCVKATVVNKLSEMRVRRNLVIYKLLVRDETGTMACTWFNNRFLKGVFTVGDEYIFYGKVSKKFGNVEMSNAEYEKVNANTKTGKIVPVYNLTEKISQNILRNYVLIALKTAQTELIDKMPKNILKEAKLETLQYSIKNIHFPKDKNSFEIARRRLVFEELFLLQLMLLKLKNGNLDKRDGIKFKDVNTDEIFSKLKFKLTNAQTRVLEEIFKDMESDKPMNRLVQGDVGSGKTIVAAISMYKAVKNNYQCVMMAPTSILAEQHYETVTELFDEIGISTAILTGNTTKKNKEKILAELLEGKIDVLIGTHAIIEDNVQFKNLGLVIADEQHRFGVNQRGKLSNKSQSADTLIMTATPIPRTLALILYGDLDMSIIDELPPGRQVIDTFAVTKDKEERVNNFIIKNVKEGRQVYIVCPLVEDSENIEAKSVEEMFKYYTDHLVNCKVEILHGKMKYKDKENIMTKFKNKEIDVLISTTVIEVGVNVPNATLMIVENAERFGLAQLHQLRGRVGRGSDKSYCILKYESKSTLVKQRMNIMEKTNDGFKISEKDLELRGSGEFFGAKQHGLPEFKIANLFTDTELLNLSQSFAMKIIQNDKKLEKPENMELRELLDERYKGKIEL